MTQDEIIEMGIQARLCDEFRAKRMRPIVQREKQNG